MRKVSDAAEEQMVLDVSSDEDFDNIPF